LDGAAPRGRGAFRFKLAEPVLPFPGSSDNHKREYEDEILRANPLRLLSHKEQVLPTRRRHSLLRENHKGIINKCDASYHRT
jgi:hypothetical protein